MVSLRVVEAVADCIYARDVRITGAKRARRGMTDGVSVRVNVDYLLKNGYLK